MEHHGSEPVRNDLETAFRSSIIGFFAVCLAGTVCHYVYELSGSHPAVGLFVPVNESVWEHLKLLFFPFVLYMAGEFFAYGKRVPGFLFARMIGVVSGMIFIPVMFYLYTAVLRRNLAPIDILLFLISVGLAFWVSFRWMLRHRSKAKGRNLAAVVVLAGIAVLFCGLTYTPPDTFLFRVP